MYHPFEWPKFTFLILFGAILGNIKKKKFLPVRNYDADLPVHMYDRK